SKRDWSSDVCSSDLLMGLTLQIRALIGGAFHICDLGRMGLPFGLEALPQPGGLTRLGLRLRQLCAQLGGIARLRPPPSDHETPAQAYQEADEQYEHTCEYVHAHTVARGTDIDRSDLPHLPTVGEKPGRVVQPRE